LTPTVLEPRYDRLARGIATVDRTRFPGADALAQETALTLIRAFGTLNALIDEQLANFGLSRPRLHVLAFLNRAGNEVRMTDVSNWLGVTRAHVTRLVDGLERDGLVVRTSSTLDRRTVFVSITPAGRQRLNGALPHHLEHLGNLLTELSEDEKSLLIHLLAKAREAMLTASGEPERTQPAFPM
jgi:DNA-binding MarR family transcriptional regulator